MPNIKSAKKRVLVTSTKNLQNKAAKSALRTDLKKFDQAAENGEKAEAQDLYKKAVVALDKAASEGLIHKNNAANKKSKMTRRLNKLA
ncbi:MAG: 30S ribosomal protein S20 [Clostridia bacterium]|nr:30S ribosomal protein S20 [Clostridia bacterium]